MQRVDKIKIGIVVSLASIFLILLFIWMLLINKTTIKNEWQIFFSVLALCGNVVVFILLTSKKISGLYIDIFVCIVLGVSGIFVGTYLSAAMAFIIAILECYGVYRWKHVKTNDVTDFNKKKIGKLTINWHYFIMIVGYILAVVFGIIEWKFISNNTRKWYTDVTDGIVCIAGIVTFSVVMFKNKYSFFYTIVFHILSVILFCLIIWENWKDYSSVDFWSSLFSLANYICIIILDAFGIASWRKANTEKIG